MNAVPCVYKGYHEDYGRPQRGPVLLVFNAFDAEGLKAEGSQAD